MNEEQLRKFLAENLSIQFDKGVDWDNGGAAKLTVKLFLGDAEISSDFQSVKEAE